MKLWFPVYQGKVIRTCKILNKNVSCMRKIKGPNIFFSEKKQRKEKIVGGPAWWPSD